MTDVHGDPRTRIADLVKQQGRALTEMLAVEALVRKLTRTERDLSDAEQKVVNIGRLIAVALGPL